MDLTSEAAALMSRAAARRRKARNSARNAANRFGPKGECSRCGTNVEAGTKFCPECGNKMVVGNARVFG